MNLLRMRCLYLLCATFILHGLSVGALAVLIDDFTDYSLDVVGPGVGFTSSNTPDSAPFGSIIGGTRYSSLTNKRGGGDTVLETKAGTLISDRVMAFSSEDGPSGIFRLSYGELTPMNGGLGVDLTVGGDNAFEIAINVSNPGHRLRLSMGVGDADGDYLGHYQTGLFDPGLITGGSPVVFQYHFDNFSPDVDFDKVTYIRFDFEAPAISAAQYEILYLDTMYVAPIPEPTAAALALAATLLLVGERQRR